MKTLTSYNPSTGAVVGAVDVTSVEEITSVVARARAAQPAWAELGVATRCEILAQSASTFIERAPELGRLLTEEMGKPLVQAIGEVKSCGADLQSHLAEFVDALEPEVIDTGRLRSVVYHDPLGVCAAITPWNFPMSMPSWMVVPALATGNTVILKPSEETPLIGQAYADVLNEVLPPDVLQVVHGADAQGKALVAADVDLIAFTGSRDAGKHILAAASNDLKRVILELGGKDPLLVLEGADLERAAKFAARNSFDNAGQVCVSTERIFVVESVAARFIDLLVEHTDVITVGDGLDEGVRVGPMINARQRSHVLGQIDDALASGATLVVGGDGNHDNFVMPTVLTGVTDEMAIATEETFGPVACVTVVPDAEAAVVQANDTPFGLGAVVFGEAEHAQAIARRLTAGMIGINRPVYGAPGTPWVGARQSGYNHHKSRSGHLNFTQTRVVSS